MTTPNVQPPVIGQAMRADGREVALWRRLAAGALVLLYASGCAHARSRAPNHTAAPQGSIMTARASGTFEVTLTPQPADDYADGASLGRMSIDKQFHGDLEATSRGQMLTGMSGVKGSAGYVAIERVDGALAGRRGTFVLQHSGIMTRGVPSLSVIVVPDSGTDQLSGLSGTMVIDITGGQHAYAFEYMLPAHP